MSVTTYNVDAGKDRATIELSGETKVVFSFDPNIIAVEAVSGSVNVSLDEGATAGDDGCDTLSEGQSTRMNPIADKCIYVNGTGTVRVWGGRSGEDCPFKSGAKGGGGSGGDGTHYKGTTTTALTDGSTTNPITILIEDEPVTYTAVMGDIVVYGSSEFIFDSNAWKEIGRGVDTTPTNGSVNFVTSDGVYKNTAGQKYYSNNTLKGEIFNNYANNTASGVNSHAEGYKTTASGYSSHAEGSNNNSTNECSHAEGLKTTASGYYSHAEGWNNTASGQASHAEGAYTEASGDYSHTSGLYTIASQPDMTAIGKYNSPNIGDLFNIGNGTKRNLRSNIVEVNSTELNVNGDIKRDGVGIDDYTTTERKIGKWIDGSDLYQRTFEVTGLVNGQWNNSVLGTSGINIVDAPSGMIYWLYNNVLNTISSINSYRDSTEFSTTNINATADDVNILPTVNGSGYTIDKAIITIKYTKPSVQNLMQTPIPTEEEISETPTAEEDMR